MEPSWHENPAQINAYVDNLEDQKLFSYDHMGFWHAMDKLSDKIYLENLWNKNSAPWKIWAN